MLMSDLEKIKNFLNEITDDRIKFKPHFYKQIKNRLSVTEGLVRSCLKDPKRLLEVEQQKAKIEEEEKYKLWFRMSNKYTLVTIAVKSEKGLYIVTAWNSDKRWQKAIQK